MSGVTLKTCSFGFCDLRGNSVDVFPKMDVRTPSIVAREQRGETVSTHRRTPSMGILSRHTDDYSSIGLRSSRGSKISNDK